MTQNQAGDPMFKPTFFALLSVACVASCGWIGGDDEEVAPTTTAPEEVNPLIPEKAGIFEEQRAERARYKGTPIDQVTEVTLERLPGGVIIRASGVSDTQGIYDARLTPNFEDGPVDGVLSFRLEAVRAQGNQAQIPVQGRDAIVAVRLTDQQFGDTRVVRVEAVRNALEARVR